MDRQARRAQGAPRNPTPPFITSRLQQEASRKLGYQPSRTMRIAQRLYEGIELGDEGAVGLITYMRTDSTRISPDAIDEVRGYIGQRYGEEYLPEKPNFYRSKKGAQDAHEAIRPTSLRVDPPGARCALPLSKEELALYTLIWNRFVASQMAPAVFDQTTVDITAADTLFRATGQIMKFDGFIRVYTEGRDDGAQRRRRGRRVGAPAAAAARGRAVEAARTAARAALHAAAAALHPGDADQGAGGEGHRPAVDLRVDHGDDPQQGVRR